MAKLICAFVQAQVNWNVRTPTSKLSIPIAVLYRYKVSRVGNCSVTDCTMIQVEFSGEGKGLLKCYESCICKVSLLIHMVSLYTNTPTNE